MKNTCASRLICLCLLLFAPAAFCQSAGFGGGIFLSIGGESAHTPHFGSGYVIPLVGAYAEWLTPRVHPGLDLRYEGGTNGVHGALVGPRASMSLTGGFVHPYAETLFGSNHANLETAGGTVIEPGQPVPDRNRDGVTIQGVAGFDVDFSRCCRWRLEFSQSRFSGIPDSHPHAVTTGIVVHFR